LLRFIASSLFIKNGIESFLTHIAFIQLAISTFRIPSPSYLGQSIQYLIYRDPTINPVKLTTVTSCEEEQALNSLPPSIDDLAYVRNGNGARPYIQ
jgi:hypothetical protein